MNHPVHCDNGVDEKICADERLCTKRGDPMFVTKVLIRSKINSRFDYRSGLAIYMFMENCGSGSLIGEFATLSLFPATCTN